MTKRIEVRKRKPYAATVSAKSKVAKIAPASLASAREVSQTLGRITRDETAKHRVKVLKSKFTDARTTSKAEAKRKGLLPNGI